MPEDTARPGAWALATLDPDLAERICGVQDAAELERFAPLLPSTPRGARPAHLGTWMVWMVHRVALDDPKLTRLDFSSYAMPPAEEEWRVAPKLARALARNGHLRELRLPDCNLHGAEGRSLAEALAENGSLRLLNVECNLLGPAELRCLFAVLARNTSLEELRCSGQFCDQPGWDTYQALADALRQNKTLRKLGLELLDAHWRDQINRALVRNTDAARRRRREEACRGETEARAALELELLRRAKQVGAAAAVARLMADAGGA